MAIVLASCDWVCFPLSQLARICDSENIAIHSDLRLGTVKTQQATDIEPNRQKNLPVIRKDRHESI